MKIRFGKLFLAAAASFLMLSTVCIAALPDRLVYLPCNFWGKYGEPHSYEFFTNIAWRAHNAGYNGVILSAHLDLMAQWGCGSYLSNRVAQAKAFCDSLGLDLVPMTWDVGYGGDCPPNWFESRTIEDLPYVRRGARAVFDPPSVEIRGGPTDRMSFSGDDGGKMPMRPTRRFTLKKGVRYVISAMARSIGVPERDVFQFIGFIPSVAGKSSYYSCHKYPHDGKWHGLVFPMEAKTDEEVSLVFGHWGKVGSLELSNLTVRARGICGATRRDGIPFIVKDAVSGVAYLEGRDYAEVPPIKVRGEGDPLGPYLELDIPQGSRIKDGTRLLVTADIPSRFGYGERAQYAACMSNEAWYRRAEDAARVIENTIHPRRWFLCFDELRSANSCAACRARNIDMAHLIGDCLSRQREIVRKVAPDAVCYVWVMQPIEAPAGKGIASIDLGGPLAYTNAMSPIVRIESETGCGASAFAHYDWDSHTVDRIEILSPGSGYEDAKVTLMFAPSRTVEIDPANVSFTENAAGGSLTKKGEGRLVLAAANTWAGATCVRGGTLVAGCDWAIPADTAVILSDGGTLDLGDRINRVSSVTYQVGGGSIARSGSAEMPESVTFEVSVDEILAGKAIPFSEDFDLSKVTLSVKGAFPDDMDGENRYPFVTTTGQFTGKPSVSAPALPAGYRFAFGPKRISLIPMKGFLVICR